MYKSVKDKRNLKEERKMIKRKNRESGKYREILTSGLREDLRGIVIDRSCLLVYRKNDREFPRATYREPQLPVSHL